MKNSLAGYAFTSFFTYVASQLTPIAAGESASLAFTVNKDSDFLWQKFTCYAQVGSASQDESTRIVPSLTVQITNQSNGRYYFNQPIPLGAICGNGPLPFILPDAALLERTAQITVDLANVGSATYSQIWVGFIGTKGYSTRPSMG